MAHNFYITMTGQKQGAIKGDVTLKGHEGAVFSLAFHPSKDQIAAGGYDGTVRIYNAATGAIETHFIPVPLRPAKPAVAAK